MQFSIKSNVKANFRFVASHFGKPLLSHLLPKFPPIRLTKFDGTGLGNLVCLELKFAGHIMTWSSQIIVTKKHDTEENFIDQGVKLPFFLVYWEHRHRIIRNGNDTVIIDEIYYKSPNMIIELLFFPILFLSFYLRRASYKSFFSKIREK